MGNLTTSLHTNPAIPPSFVGLSYISTSITSFIILPTLFPSVAVFSTVTGVYSGAPLSLDWNWDVCVDLLPEAAVDARLKNFYFLLHVCI